MNRKIFINTRILDVVGQKVFEGWFSILNEKYEYVERGRFNKDLEGELIDLKGLYSVPGLIDSHMHIESSLATPAKFVKQAMKHGTAVILQDPHEMANVFGEEGIRFMERNSENLPIDIYTAISSCVPTTRYNLETENSEITRKNVKNLSQKEKIIALGEVMDYEGLVRGNEELVGIVEEARKNGLSIEGHCPTLKGLELSRYIYRGVTSDHTLTNPKKIEEQLRKGMWVMIQTKSVTEENIDYINSLKDKSRILLVTDDIFPNRLIKEHLNSIVNLSIKFGMDPTEAISSATLRPAQYLNLKEYGMISPGKVGSFFTVESLEKIIPQKVFLKGRDINEYENFKTEDKEKFKFKCNFNEIDINLFKFDKEGKEETNIVLCNRDNSETKLIKENILFKEGILLLENTDLVQVNVFSRKKFPEKNNGGFLKGFGLKRGAYASSFSHDSHNIMVVGSDHSEMKKAVDYVLQNEGGMVYITGDEILFLPLPIGGVITDDDVTSTAEIMQIIKNKMIENGALHKNPLLFLSVLALTVSPYYKFSDLGLVDVEKTRIIDIFN